MNGQFEGYCCWQPERIGEVISKVALAVERPEFLATHVPMRRIAYEQSPLHVAETDETSLVDELERARSANEHIFAVIKGIPGTGKSHVIRWLKEQYTLAHPDDAVLLIARANTSLRGTIEQIIASNIFSQEALNEAVKRLEGAVDALAQETLAERLLNGLQEATHALDWAEVQERLGTLHRRITPRKVERFLLDHCVREFLKSSDGPVDRVVAFLTGGTGTNEGIDHVPGVEPDDLDFDPASLRRIKQEGYREVHELCDDLHLRDEIRTDLARYLNHALRSYAISHATNLAASDMRTMFEELRRQLRIEGRELALFIEDITALTGIDEGLIEALINDHRGEGGGGLCRLTSITGVTDTFYSDRLPDNIKQRVTHRLTLNAAQGRQESDLLRDPETRAEFAARYLNAIRLSAGQLRSWAEHGARPDALPIACETCRFRGPCHAAFGSMRLLDDRGRGPVHEVGLYPFNRAAINTLYEFLREEHSRTPRTFLADQLAYILQSHGNKLGMSEFPPPVGELVRNVAIPGFSPPAHSQLVLNQGGAAAKRLETLFLFWGERNVFGRTDGGVRVVGGLRPEVFQAFGLPQLAGSQLEGATIPKPQVETIEKPAPGPTKQQTSKYTQYLNDWTQGQPLYGYDRFADWMAALVNSFIDWQTHGISLTQAHEYVAAGRFALEGQSGALMPNRTYLHFKRTPELRQVFQALADFNDPNVAMQPDQYGEHLATLSTWLRSEEPRVVEFVREPTGKATEPGYLTRILLLNCVGLACLAGELTPAAAGSNVDLYQQLIVSCVRSSADGWKSQVQQAQVERPQAWLDLMRKVNVQEAVHVCRSELLQLLNRPQGSSSNVRYLDAATALGVLADFNATEWCYTPLPVHPQTNDRIWSSALVVYDALAERFAATCRGAHDTLSAAHTRLRAYLGNATPKDAFDAIRNLLHDLKQVRAYDSRLDSPFDGSGALAPDDLARLLEQVEAHLGSHSPREVATGLSYRYVRWQASQKQYLAFFDLFKQTAESNSAYFEREIGDLRQRSSSDQHIARAKKAYAAALSALASIGSEVAQ